MWCKSVSEGFKILIAVSVWIGALCKGRVRIALRTSVSEIGVLRSANWSGVREGRPSGSRKHEILVGSGVGVTYEEDSLYKAA